METKRSMFNDSIKGIKATLNTFKERSKHSIHPIILINDQYYGEYRRDTLFVCKDGKVYKSDTLRQYIKDQIMYLVDANDRFRQLYSYLKD